MLVPSANDAAEALALHVGKGSTSRFVALMNARGMSWDSSTRTSRIRTASTLEVTSALACAILVRYALGVPFIRDALDRSTVVLPGGRDFPTTDDLLVSWPALVGGKTGHTRGGLVAAAGASAGGATVYGAVLGSVTRSSRNGALRDLLTYGLEQYLRVAAIDTGRGYAEPETGYGKGPVELDGAARDETLRIGDAARRACGRADVGRAPGAEGPASRPGRRLRRKPARRVLHLVAARSVAEPGLLGKARWYATQTAANLWGLVT